MKLYLGRFPENYTENDYPLDFYCLLGNKNWTSIINSYDFLNLPWKKEDEITLNQECYTLADAFVKILSSKLNFKYSLNLNPEEWYYIIYPWLIQSIMCIKIRELTANEIIKIYSHQNITIVGVINNINSYKNYNHFLNMGLTNPDFHGWLITNFLLKKKALLDKWEWEFIELENLICNENISPRNISIIDKIENQFSRVMDLPGLNVIDKCFFTLLLKFKNHDKYNFPLLENNKIEEEKINCYLPLLMSLLLDEFNVGFHKKKNKKKGYFFTASFLSNSNLKRVIEGEKPIGIQHGAHYGMSSHSLHDIEYKRGFFFSWGWDNFSENKYKIIPTPFPLLQKYKIHKNEFSNDLLYISSLILQPDFRFYSMPKSLEWLKYLNDQKEFYTMLRNEWKKIFLYRPFPLRNYEYFDTYEFLSNYFPEIKCFEGKINDKLFSSRLVIMDAPDTSFLYRLVVNKPIFLLWKKSFFPYNQSFNKFYEKFLSLGIIHESVESLVDFTNNKYESLEVFWEKALVQEFLDEFKSKYLLTSRNWRFRLLKNIIKI